MSMQNQVNIRLQLGNKSNPPVGPIDAQTGTSPAIWRGSTVFIDVGIFDAKGAAVDLSDYDFLEVDIFPAAIANLRPGTNYNYNPYAVSPYPNLPPAPLEFVTIPQVDITDIIPLDEWEAGNTEQATAIFSAVQTLNLELNGKQSADFWLVVQAIKADKSKVTFGGTRLTVYESGAQGIYLPNNLAPLDVPEETILYIAPNQQMIFSQTITIEGTVVIDGGILIQV